MLWYFLLLPLNEAIMDNKTLITPEEAVYQIKKYCIGHYIRIYLENDNGDLNKYIQLYCLNIELEMYDDGFKNIKFISHNSEFAINSLFEEPIIDHINHRNLEIYDNYIQIFSRIDGIIKIERRDGQ